MSVLFEAFLLLTNKYIYKKCQNRFHSNLGNNVVIYCFECTDDNNKICLNFVPKWGLVFIRNVCCFELEWILKLEEIFLKLKLKSKN